MGDWAGLGRQASLACRRAWGQNGGCWEVFCREYSVTPPSEMVGGLGELNSSSVSSSLAPMLDIVDFHYYELSNRAWFKRSIVYVANDSICLGLIFYFLVSSINI